MSKTFGQASFQRTDVASAATIDLTDVTTRRVRITGSTGPVTSILMNPWQMLDVVFASTPTINHGAALDVANNGNNRPVQANDTCTLAADGSSNVAFHNFQPHTTQARLNMAQSGVIDFGGAGNIAESGDALNFNAFGAGYVFNNGPIIVGVSANCMQLINGQDVTPVQVARFEGDRATPTNGDEAYISGYLAPSTGANVEFMRFSWGAADVTAGSVDGTAGLWLPVNSTMAKRWLWTPTAFSPNANDGGSIGTSSLGVSDVYLASGGFIDWAAGDVRITHNAGSSILEFGGAGGGYNFGDAATDMITLTPGGAATQLAVRRDAASIPIVLHAQNYGITAQDFGANVRFSFGTGGALGGTAAEMNVLSTEDWSAGSARSAKYRFNVRTDDSLNVVLDILERGIHIAPTTGMTAGGNVAQYIKLGQSGPGFYVGTGAPSITAAKGSVYINTTATTTTTRFYINTDGGTTWTNFTTAA